MFNLLRGEMYKLPRIKSFYGCLVAAATLILMLYGSLATMDMILSDEALTDEDGVVITAESEDMIEEDADKMADESGDESKEDEIELDEPISYMQDVGIIGVLEQMFGGGFVMFIFSIFVNIFIISEYTSGVVKNFVGKGYPRETVFFGKCLSIGIATVVFYLLVTIITTLMGILFMGTEGIKSVIWDEFACYVGLQILFGVSITAIVALMGELTRNMAAGIAATFGILLFSSTITSGLDLLFSKLKLGIEPSKYWILSVQGDCPATGFENEYLIRGIVVALGWLLIAVSLGLLHFKKADVK